MAAENGSTTQNGSAARNGSNGPESAPTFTPEEDAEDLGRLLREARAMQDVSVAELARRTDRTADDVLDFEAGRVVPARPQFAVYLEALGYSPA
ncbi:Helix-turn-helix domain-containing protein [Pseudonocardia ammonioxydans]|uniref:Helix-turn-helix domain-containing protein n=1 Tax=Pseudonocardia ammonioxydans TaxID=260086 RepID=A0A1I4Z7M2_PSUAM|nr:helix-turn-helix transcriptional regulator [Pseudonocardia ammonioxydans]SFN46282.1 Helix-turn-helix domain-containing protein [Pseudonocardia ammonioxydans]